MSTNQEINIDDIIASLPSLDNSERLKLQQALFEFQNDLDLKVAIQEELEDIKSGRISSHLAVMKEIRAAL